MLKKRLLIGLGLGSGALFTEFQLKNRKGQDTRNIMIVRISTITADAMESVDSVLKAIQNESRNWKGIALNARAS